MKKFFWNLEAAYHYHRCAAVPLTDSFRMAEGLYEMYDEHPPVSPLEAVLEDLTYWGD